MKEIKTFEDVDEVLAEYIPPLRSFRTAYTLDTMQALMESLGNPQNSYKTIHVAGTSGKTSTAYFMAACLQASGKNVGLSVSPHVDNVNERVQINLEPLNLQRYCTQFTKFISIIKKLAQKPTYFELLIAFAFWQFAEDKVDYAVIEVGLGGLLDGTNVITRADKVCVITDIGLDHVAVLGHSLAGIADQKAGISGPGNHVFCFQQSEEIDQAIKNTVDARGGILHPQVAPEVYIDSVGLALFQMRNYSLAKITYDFVAQRDGLQSLTTEQESSVMKTYIPGRIEIVERNGKTLILDAAHNAQKMQTLVPSIQQKFPNQKFVVLFALLKSNDAKIHDVLQALLPIADHLIITDFIGRQDLRKRSTAPSTLAQEAKQLGFTTVEILHDTDQAYARLMSLPGDHALITGSFYLLHDIHAKILTT
jgi:dihydrofolate synthase/folylpolyglutamate synthase